MSHPVPTIRSVSRRCAVVIPAAMLAAVLGACNHHSDDPAAGTPPPAATPAPVYSAELTRTTHGVVHVKADDFKGAGYGLAYAYAQDNLCMFADALLTVRGERSQFFGGDAHATQRTGDEYGAGNGFMDLKNEDSDFFYKAYLDLDQLRTGYAAASKEARDLLDGYVAGYNRYLKDNAGKLPAECQMVSMPIE